MKSNSRVSLWVLAVAGAVGAAGVVSAQTSGGSTSTATTTAPAEGHHQGHGWHGHHGGLLLGVTLRATKQLNLTAEQQASIKTILSNARTQAKAARASNQSSLDMSVLGNPGDPNYATALQSAKALAASRIQTESELQGQIYNVLTAQQKAQLPAVLASMKEQAAQRRAAWEQRHAASSNAG
jgi:Spy/CpxP family protein refolding chaperone